MGPKMEKNVPTLPGKVFGNFRERLFFGQTPAGRNRRFTGILATRALKEILGPKMAQKCQKRAVVPPWGAVGGPVAIVDGQNTVE